MAKKIKLPKTIEGNPLSKKNAQLIVDHFLDLKNRGILKKDRDFDEWYNKHQGMMELFFTKPIQQATNYSPKFIVQEATKVYTNKQINGKNVSLEKFENSIDRFETFMYTKFEGIANIRYHPAVTLKTNIINLDFPTREKLQEWKEMDIDDIIEEARSLFNIDIYYSPLK